MLRESCACDSTTGNIDNGHRRTRDMPSCVTVRILRLHPLFHLRGRWKHSRLHVAHAWQFMRPSTRIAVARSTSHVFRTVPLALHTTCWISSLPSHLSYCFGFVSCVLPPSLAVLPTVPSTLLFSDPVRRRDVNRPQGPSIPAVFSRSLHGLRWTWAWVWYHLRQQWCKLSSHAHIHVIEANKQAERRTKSC